MLMGWGHQAQHITTKLCHGIYSTLAFVWYSVHSDGRLSNRLALLLLVALPLITHLRLRCHVCRNKRFGMVEVLVSRVVDLLFDIPACVSRIGPFRQMYIILASHQLFMIKCFDMPVIQRGRCHWKLTGPHALVGYQHRSCRLFRAGMRQELVQFLRS